MVDISNRTHLVVTQHTTIHDLKNFTDQLKDGQKIRASKTDHGVVLYAKDGKSSAVAKFFGVSDRRRNLAKSTIRDIIGRTANDLAPKLDKIDADNSEFLLGKIAKDGLTGKKTPTAERLKGLVNTTSAITHGGNRTEDRPISDMKISGMFGDQAAGKLLEDIAKELKSCLDQGIKENTRDEVSDKIATKLHDLIDKKFGGDKTEGAKFLRDNLPQLRRDLKEGCKTELSKLTNLESTRDLLGVTLDGVFSEATEKVAIKMLELPKSSNGDFKIGTTTYKMGDQLAKGGFGAVSVLTAPGKDDLVVKISSDPQYSDTLKVFSDTSMSEEYMRHLAAQGDPPHENIIQVKGAFKLDNESIAIAMERAPHGDFVDFMFNAQDALKNGLISKHDYKMVVLSLFRDVASGVASMQSRGITHSDLKADNLMIGKGGVGKVVDMGTVQAGNSFTMNNSTQIDSPQTLPPEINMANRERPLVAKTYGMSNNVKAELSKQILPLFDRDQTTQKNIMSVFGRIYNDGYEKDLQPKLTNWAEKHKGSPKIDTWQLGMALFAISTGGHLTDGLGMTLQVEEKIANFPKDMLAVGENGYFGKTTGDEDLDDLINMMLVSDPNDRPTMDVILQEAVLQDSSLNSQMVKELIVDISKGSPTLKKERQSLNDELDNIIGGIEKSLQEVQGDMALQNPQSDPIEPRTI